VLTPGCQQTFAARKRKNVRRRLKKQGVRIKKDRSGWKDERKWIAIFAVMKFIVSLCPHTVKV
jgi:hypothetical protein